MVFVHLNFVVWVSCLCNVFCRFVVVLFCLFTVVCLCIYFFSLAVLNTTQTV